MLSSPKTSESKLHSIDVRLYYFIIMPNMLLKKLLKKYHSHTKISNAISVSILLLIIIIIYNVFNYNKNSIIQETKIVECKPAILGSIKQTIRLVGTIKAKKSTVFTAKVIGTVEQIADAGIQVEKGELIAKLENADLEYSVQLSEDSAKIAKEQYDRTLILGKSNAISKKSMDEAKAQWITAQKALATAKLELDKTKFMAPFSGTVGAYKVRDGSQVTQGEQIVTLFDPSKIIVEFDIPATVLNKIHSGQKVIIDNKTLHIEHVQKMVDPNTNMSPAIVDYPCENCFIGENIDVDLVIEEKNNILVVPTSAVFLKNGTSSVYTVEDNMTILKPVTTGLQEQRQIEIVDGIKEHDLIIIRGQSRLYPFSKVKIFQDDNQKTTNEQL